MKKLKLVMVGNGMAGVRTLEELIKVAPDLYDITVFGAEPHPNYNRILLSPVLAGEQTLDEIVLNSWDWYKENNVTLHAGKKVVQVDRVRRIVRAEDGTEEEYDRLLMCTGSSPFILPVPGNDLPGVISYRDISDTDAMIDAARRYRHAVVIGGGLLGLEAANGLKLRGMDVTVVHLADWLLERQLDQMAGRMLQKSLEDRGLTFLLGKQTEALIAGESGRVAALRLKDGQDLGDIKEFMIDMATGKVAYAVLSFGGLLGMGDKLFAVPWAALTLDTTNKRFTLDVLKEVLSDAPGFNKDSWPAMSDRTWASGVHKFYGTPYAAD